MMRVTKSSHLGGSGGTLKPTMRGRALAVLLVGLLVGSIPAWASSSATPAHSAKPSLLCQLKTKQGRRHHRKRHHSKRHHARRHHRRHKTTQPIGCGPCPPPCTTGACP